ncbi:MAG: hypothetical protein ACHQFZ_09530 [Acidimicrobiales bacterium]
MGDARDVTSDGSPSPRSPIHSAMRTHLALAGGLALCAVAFWIEVRRALGGNALSWAYVFEWPLLGAFAVYMWWRVRHPAARPRRAKAAPLAPEYESMRAAWEEHRRSLTGADDAPADQPGRS